jgi:hypothetical protein
MGYIPGPDSEFDVFFANLLKYVTVKAAAVPLVWDHIPPRMVTALSRLHSVWDAAYAKTRGPHTSVDTKRKNEARAAAVAALREFVQRFLIWEPVTDDDRTAMMLPVGDKTNTPQDKPVIHVGFTLGIHQIYEVLLRFWVLETGRGYVPDNMIGVMLYYLVSGAPVTSHADLPARGLLTRHIEVLTFPPECRGKTVYVACRWISARGKEGEPSPIQSIVIP